MDILQDDGCNASCFGESVRCHDFVCLFVVVIVFFI